MKFVRRTFGNIQIVNMFYFLLSSLSQGSGYHSTYHILYMYAYIAATEGSRWERRTEIRVVKYRWLLYVLTYFVHAYIIIDNCITQYNRKIYWGKNNIIEYIRIVYSNTMKYILIHPHVIIAIRIYFLMTAIVRNSIAIIYFSVTLGYPLFSLCCAAVCCVDDDPSVRLAKAQQQSWYIHCRWCSCALDILFKIDDTMIVVLLLSCEKKNFLRESSYSTINVLLITIKFYLRHTTRMSQYHQNQEE